jgi:hypothetical protein
MIKLLPGWYQAVFQCQTLGEINLKMREKERY